VKKSGAVAGISLEKIVPGKLHSQIASKSVRALDDDVGTPVPAMRSSIDLKPGRSAIGSEPLTAAS
jgi:hypothetical protein